ncbi:streptogrisin C [Haloactinopolyspora alba]|uniref:Streptogrisin C n=1 Tax=Haloactinopolyspora alba TaxID=648780 RepID=A0A2P8DJ80_9ACTN|nr:S1 family peptidase [Haloactinopolyspora alba]PSK97248.1 streptogrisin C [Haloactinopolyspora alba]
MARKLTRASAAVGAAGLIAATLGLTASASEDRPPESAPADVPDVVKTSPEVAAAMQRDLGLDHAAAAERLAFQAEASETRRDLSRELGADYAGTWVDPDANELYVGVTDADAASVVREAGGSPVVVTYPLSQLESWRAELDAAASQAPSTVPGWYVDVTENRIVINTHRAGRAAAGAFARENGVPPRAFDLVTTDENPRPLIDVVGGNAYYIDTGSRCSVGFSVQGGFVTAGHCGNAGSTTTQPSGTFRGSSFPVNDYAWVEVGAGNTPVGAVNDYSGGRVDVAGSTEAPVGSSVCRSGSTTGWHCGTILARDTSVSYPQGTVHGLIRTDVCAEPGDSGGSLVAGNQAQGVTSGGSGNCTSGGTTYFQPVNEILGAYSLDLVTNGGGEPPDPPEGSCDEYPNVFSGSLSSGGQQAQPDGSYFYSGSGTHEGCLDGPTGSDFDLYLQQWSGSRWSTVARSISSGPDEQVTHDGSAGYFRYVVHAYSGSGSYTMGIDAP